MLDASAEAAAVSAAALQVAAADGLWPEPEWVQRAADDLGYEWARLAWRRAAAVPGAWFDYAKADAVVRLWPQIFCLTEDRFAGKPFRLVFWQEITVRLLFGWKAPLEIVDEETGEARSIYARLFRQLRLWIPRKNGKSEFLAALALLVFAIEGAVAGQGYAFARDEKQAKIVFDKMKAMVAFAPSLSKKVRVFKKSLYVPEIRALFELLTGKPEGKHGRSPTVIVGDEMHEWASDDLADTLRQGTGARLQPLELYASTAGLKTAATGVKLWDESLAILDGRIDDPTTLVVIFAAGADDDWKDEANWRKANPSLGLSPTIAFLRREAARAIDNPRAEASFRRYHLNQWVDAVVRWLSLKKWDACASDATAWRRLPDELKGRKCFGAFDVSATTDLTSLVWLFPPLEGETLYRVLARFWVPEDTLAERVKRDRVSYDRWKDAGALETTPGDYVDQNFVKAAILEGLAAYDVETIGYDPWNAAKLVTDLQRDGVDPDRLVEMRQGIQTLGEPTKQTERLIYAGLLDHGGNPLLRWQAGNAEVRFDENMNFAPAKKRSRDKIDGIVATVMAVGLSIRPEDQMALTGADILTVV